MKVFYLICLVYISCFFKAYSAQPGADTIMLAKPVLTKGKPVMQALKDRKSTRSFSEKDIDMQTLSEIFGRLCKSIN